MSDMPPPNSQIPDRVADDAGGMRAALAWSRRGRGWTSPRPSVGCVLVRDGRVLGGGHTQPGDGNPHAEVMALRAAAETGHDPRGATAYVTLEPCSHYRTTPPCTKALIEAGIARAVCGVGDPNPEVNGRGYELLRAAGIEVVTGFMAAECARAQEDFLKHIVTHTPFVTLKCAVTLDGKIATASGDSQWISNEASRRRAHVLRHEHDAVLVGIDTVLADDPQLSVRLPGRWKQPARIVLDSRGRLPLSAKLLCDTETAPVFVATAEAMPPERRAALEACGARILQTSSGDGRVNLPELWRQLYDCDIYSVLIEGGAHVVGAALASRTVDKVVFFVAPLIIGGDGMSAIAGFGVQKLADAHRLHDVHIEQLNDDVMISGYVTQLAAEVMEDNKCTQQLDTL
jgi:diaminohydroxyphosphoribosylaminopyrimidine deaminase / 5-amino-6-(5-phosphoribosylamino)uracil reductase